MAASAGVRFFRRDGAQCQHSPRRNDSPRMQPRQALATSPDTCSHSSLTHSHQTYFRRVTNGNLARHPPQPPRYVRRYASPISDITTQSRQSPWGFIRIGSCRFTGDRPFLSARNTAVLPATYPPTARCAHPAPQASCIHRLTAATLAIHAFCLLRCCSPPPGLKVSAQPL